MQNNAWFIKCILILTIDITIVFYGLNANADIWQPKSGYVQMPIWPVGKMPDALSTLKKEYVTTITQPLIAGKPFTEVWDVTQPTMTVYPPKTKNTGAAIVVFPGGGFHALAIDLEGTEVCEWLTTKGITCVLLKYRVPNSGPNWDSDCQCEIHPQSPTALEDAQRTLGLLRFNAAKWHINPHKIGVMGFSAGGFMVADTSTNYKTRAYVPIDAADKESCRPDFAMAFYPGHIRVEGTKLILNPDIHFTKDTPPTFIVQAENDPQDTINHSLVYYIGLKNADVPVEMHLYAQGGHGFGIRKTDSTITEWPQLAEAWLKTIKML